MQKKSATPEYAQDTDNLTRRDIWKAIKDAKEVISFLLLLLGVVVSLFNYWIGSTVQPLEKDIAAQSQRIDSLKEDLIYIRGKLDRMTDGK